MFEAKKFKAVVEGIGVSTLLEIQRKCDRVCTAWNLRTVSTLLEIQLIRRLKEETVRLVGSVSTLLEIQPALSAHLYSCRATSGRFNPS